MSLTVLSLLWLAATALGVGVIVALDGRPKTRRLRLPVQPAYRSRPALAPALVPGRPGLRRRGSS